MLRSDDNLVSRIDYAYARALNGNDTVDPDEPNYTRTVRFIYYGAQTDSLQTTPVPPLLGLHLALGAVPVALAVR